MTLEDALSPLYLVPILWLFLESFTPSTVEMEEGSEFVYNSKTHSAVRIVRDPPEDPAENAIKAHISALDFKILGYLSSDPTCGLSTSDLINIIMGLTEGKPGDEVFVTRHIINSRLYTMLRSKKIIRIEGDVPIWLRFD